MTLKEAIVARHSVRNYKEEPLPEDIICILRDKINEYNAEAGLHIQLVTEEPKAFSGIMAYGSFSGVRNYFVMAGRKGDDLDEKIGWYGEHLVLLAQSLGLNTCWAGISYSKIAGTYELSEGEKIGCYIALGYGTTQGRGHKVKSVQDVSNAGESTPQWFKDGVEAALLAPTAVNQQKFFFEYQSPKDGASLPVVAARPVFSMIGYTRMDLGIVKYHFALAAGTDNFRWA